MAYLWEEMTDRERKVRLAGLISDAQETVNRAIEEQITGAGKEVAGIAILFSGGKDSTVLAHLFSGIATHIVHCNTGIGIEQTRQFVRDCARNWQLPLIEPIAAGNNSYETLVMGECRAMSGPNQGNVVWAGGFPGPGGHSRMFQRLKERGVETARAQIVDNPYRKRVIFLAGRRLRESGRRVSRAFHGEMKEIERKGAAVYVSPLLQWSAIDMNTYRMVNPGMPHNEITDLIHMSGECLCGAFASEGELEQLEMWDATAQAAQDIRKLEKKVRESGKFPPRVCQWGWGWQKDRPPVKSLMCGNCPVTEVG